jgi:hypothetical protein
MNKDRLDGTAKGGCLFELFTLPGRIILWIQYMNPSSKGGQWTMVAQTKRRASSPVMTVLYSLAFWAVVSFCVYGYFTDTPQTITPAAPVIESIQDHVRSNPNTDTPEYD